MSKMFKYDGIYQRESFDKEYATALLMEMGFSEADIKLMTDRKNVDRITMMENKDKTITHLEEFSLAPHLNYTTTTKIGEAFKMKKPYPCTITWIKTTDDEFVTRIEINGKIVLYKYLFNNFGFTKICTIEGGTLVSKEIFTKLNPDINGFYELEKEENLPELQKRANRANLLVLIFPGRCQCFGK